MSCCMNKNKEKNKVHFINEVFEPRPPIKNLPVKRRESIYPMKPSKKEEIKINKQHIEEEGEKREAFTNKFTAEIIQCGKCKEKIALNDKALQIHCGSCNEFFCCGIAGACVGPECNIISPEKKESLKYCNGCVNMYLNINIQNDGQCLCKKCEASSDIPNYYRET